MSKRRSWFAVLFPLFLVFTGGTAHAGTAMEALRAFYSGVESLHARFQQTLLDDRGEVVQRASGELWMQRPGRFRWDYQDPYRQLIVGDGTRFWLYDEDLEQVTVKRMDAALGTTPAMVLSGRQPLEENFRIEEAGQRAGVEWVALEPRRNDTDFALMRVGFLEGQLRELELEDRLGQVTRIRILDLERNPDLDPELFTFTPPAGVEVVEQQGS
ncbi:MAG TPA: outer membrane lipoprotein chaperone LolA [Thiotrichales bacterium]|nr:outer membrane lipoprotein chaperone LolA [Thiotrichales bacterium]